MIKWNDHFYFPYFLCPLGHIQDLLAMPFLGGGGEKMTVRGTMEHSEVCNSCLFFGVFSKVNCLSV